MSTHTEAVRNCFAELQIMGKPFLEMAADSMLSRDFNAATRGAREPTPLARNCQAVMDRVQVAVDQARADERRECIALLLAMENTCEVEEIVQAMLGRT